ncbi:MAG TPA: ABC transporter permease [Bacteroidales bacterium]|nr:ABC transporter permease [Bacteroidales bacterium]
MYLLKIAWRKLFRKGEHSLTRIISLSAGLAFAMLLLSEVFYYYSFDDFYPDADRIYVVYENFKADKSSDKISNYNKVSGAIAPGLKAEVPGIEAASRLNRLGPSVFYTKDNANYYGEFSLADESLFDVLPRPMLYGNPVEILKNPMTCMVSDKIASMMGGDIIGETIELKEYPGKILTISGIFKALPENTNYKYDVLISMVSTGSFMWDGTNNWLGNDRYYACVKLEKGVSPGSIAPAVRKMQETHQDIDRLEKLHDGMVLAYSLKPLKKVHLESVRDMSIILSAIAFAVLLVSLMNYILLTLSALVSRAKTSAIYKAFGAQAWNLQMMIFIETSILFLVSIFGAFMIITTIQPLIESQTGHTLSSVLNPVVIWPLVLILLIILITISYLPGRFYARVPVAKVFHNFHQKGNNWKLVLLAMQFAGAAFILTLLVIVIMQYDKLIKADHGYQAENVYFGSTSGMPGNKLSFVLSELRSLPQVETVGVGYSVPVEGASGNNIRIPGEDKDLFNVADFYWIDENYFSILNIPVIQGTGFSPETCVANDFLISHKGAEMLMVNSGWKDAVIGKQITLTEHGTNTIRGIFPDFVIHSFIEPDLRPAVFSYLPDDKFGELIENKLSFSCYILVKVYEGTTIDIMKKIENVLNDALPHKDAVIKNLDIERNELYSSLRGFRTAMVGGNIVILLITFLGLLGYIVTEVSRRTKELAIRKISGASFSQILKLFVKDLDIIAIPAVITGLLIAWTGAQKWMENFVMKTSLPWWIFAICGMSILLFISLVAILNYIIIANRNPVEAIRHE